MNADSSKPNKLRNLYTIRSTARHVTIQNRKIYYIKIKVIALIINFRKVQVGNDQEKEQSENDSHSKKKKKKKKKRGGKY